jgi:hypothetical protein
MDIEYKIKDMAVKDIAGKTDVVVEVTVTAVHILPNTSSVKLTKTISLDFVDSENFIEFESLTKENVLSFIDKTGIENELQEKINQYGKVYKMPANW